MFCDGQVDVVVESFFGEVLYGVDDCGQCEVDLFEFGQIVVQYYFVCQYLGGCLVEYCYVGVVVDVCGVFLDDVVGEGVVG